MPWIKVIGPDEASGELKQHYDEAIGRAGKVWNIVSIMSQNPAAMKASMNVLHDVGHEILLRDRGALIGTGLGALS
jgi:hypothetical protein